MNSALGFQALSRMALRALPKNPKHDPLKTQKRENTTYLKGLPVVRNVDFKLDQGVIPAGPALQQYLWSALMLNLGCLWWTLETLNPKP